MCGIVGIFAYQESSSAVDVLELRSMRDAMLRRGPDGSGEWVSGDRRVALGHRRLAIIDLHERAAQPMHSADGRLHVTFNGEIYNYKALRAELEHKGFVFQTGSDTEVLLHLYRDRGLDMLQCLRGMYAFGLWDAQRRGLLLARDPLGIKPLYYTREGGTVRFASQVKALLAGGRVSRTRSNAAAVGFHLWGSVPEPHTSYAAISALPAGGSLWIDAAGSFNAARHFSVAACWAQACSARPATCAPADVQARVGAALRDSVASHLVADVPVSTFLSAGIDSGALAGLMSEQAAGQTHAITLRFSEFSGDAHDETPLAAAVAHHYGLTHHVRTVDRGEFLRDLPAIVGAMDQPTIDGLNTWFVSKATAELGLKVAVSGLGGDELFGGYPSFRAVPRMARAAALPGRIPGLGKGVRRLLAPWLARVPRVHPKLAGALEYGHTTAGAYMLKRALFMPWELPDLLPSDVVFDGLAQLTPQAELERLLDPTPHSKWAQVAVLEATQYMRNQLLRDTDWASMAHSLEVRVPLVDHVLLSKLAPSLMHSQRTEGKRWLANSPQRALPDAVRRRPKTGFSTPIADWLQAAPELDSWRAIKSLRDPHTPWARRYAYGLYRLLA
ncbi:MAG TPA: asparagine synthase (glutamine-hydrolyzing) [Polyangiales bacterium]|nr:asparagine synthase (glutamine-hydrolyzing) [Polyangiales bacterium]